MKKIVNEMAWDIHAIMEVSKNENIPISRIKIRCSEANNLDIEIYLKNYQEISEMNESVIPEISKIMKKTQLVKYSMDILVKLQDMLFAIYQVHLDRSTGVLELAV